jgi:hypothetical protein
MCSPELITSLLYTYSSLTAILGNIATNKNLVTFLGMSNEIAWKRFLLRGHRNHTRLTHASLLQKRHDRFLISVRESGYTISIACITARTLAKTQKALLVQLRSTFLERSRVYTREAALRLNKNTSVPAEILRNGLSW